MTDRIQQIEPSKVSERLATLREWIGLSQQQMAAACAMKLAAYREWERPGHRQWHRIGFLAKVCQVTNVSPSWLLTGSFHLEPLSPIPLACDALPMPKRLRPPEAQELELLVDAIVDRAPANVLRQAALDYFSARGVPERQAITSTDRLMRDLTNIRTKEVTTDNHCE